MNNRKNQDYETIRSYNLIYQKIKLTSDEQKLVVALALLVQPEDVEFKGYNLKITYLAELFNSNKDDMHEIIINTTKSIMQKVFDIDQGLDAKGKPQFTQSALISSVTYNADEDIVILKISDAIKPFFLDIKKFFESSKTNNILQSSGKYTLTLYEILKRFQIKQNKNTITLNFEELREALFATAKTYNLYGDFKRKVITPAVNEINELSDITVTFSPVKDSRKIVAITFEIK